VESREVSEGVVLDYDAEGNLVSIDIDNASKKIELDESTIFFDNLTIRQTVSLSCQPSDQHN